MGRRWWRCSVEGERVGDARAPELLLEELFVRLRRLRGGDGAVLEEGVELAAFQIKNFFRALELF